MTARLIRWVACIVMLALLALFVASPALADVTPIDLDQLTHGSPAKEDGWIYDADGKIAGYTDSSIEVTITYDKIKPQTKKKEIPTSIVKIRIADPSQIRTAMSNDTYSGKARVKATTLAANVNAIAAVNGDFFKYYNNIGYIIRQGVFYRDASNGKRDVLIIDSNGDFHSVYAGTTQTIEAAIAELPEGVTPINTFNLGPVLIENGEVRNMKETVTAKVGDFQWKYAMQRVAIVQLGTLEYAIIECDGRADASKGMTLQEFAEYINELFPDCILAYNLDGGGSTNVIVNNERIHKNPDGRDITDIIYFASAED